MKKEPIVELVDDENLENALILREKYIENASLPQKTVIFMITKRIFAACLALLFLIIPASVFVIEKESLPPHAYTPVLTETKHSFKELNDILGSEHLYNNLPEENTTQLSIHYGWEDPKTCNNLIDLGFLATNSAFNDVGAQNFSDSAMNAILNHPTLAPSPVSVSISQNYSYDEQRDVLILQIIFDRETDDSLAPTDVVTNVHGITVSLAFPESQIPYAQASFVYQEHLYILSLISNGEPDIDHYLEILLKGIQS